MAQTATAIQGPRSQSPTNSNIRLSRQIAAVVKVSNPFGFAQGIRKSRVQGARKGGRRRRRREEEMRRIWMEEECRTERAPDGETGWGNWRSMVRELLEQFDLPMLTSSEKSATTNLKFYGKRWNHG